MSLRYKAESITQNKLLDQEQLQQKGFNDKASEIWIQLI
jgi:hypothetical protein